MCQVTVLTHYYVSASAVAFPPSGTVPNHTGQLNATTHTNTDFSAGLETYPVYYADEMTQTSSCEVPHTAGKPRNYHARKKKSASSTRQYSYHSNVMQQPTIPRYHHSKHPLPLLRHFSPLPVPRRQHQQSQVLVLLLVDGVLVSWVDFAACLFGIRTVNIRASAVAILLSATSDNITT